VYDSHGSHDTIPNSSEDRSSWTLGCGSPLLRPRHFRSAKYCEVPFSKANSVLAEITNPTPAYRRCVSNGKAHAPAVLRDRPHTHLRITRLPRPSSLRIIPGPPGMSALTGVDVPAYPPPVIALMRNRCKHSHRPVMFRQARTGPGT